MISLCSDLLDVGWSWQPPDILWVDFAVFTCACTHEYSDNLLVDTGSSNTWVGAGKAFVKTSTSKATGQQVVRYVHQIVFTRPLMRVSYVGG